MYDIIVLGGGPAGLSAAIYAKRAGKTVLVIERFAAGGQLMNTPDIENYPGLGKLPGWELAEKLERHARDLKAELLLATASSLTIDNGIFTVNGAYKSKALIFALGAARRRLNCAGEDQFAGRGVSYCATCDGGFFKGKPVVVVGGGDTALEDARYLKALGCAVTLVHRREEFRTKQSYDLSGIALKLGRQVVGIEGGQRVERVTLDNGERLDASAVFIAVGVVPNTELLRGLVPLCESGHVAAGEDCRTAVPRLYVAGDARKKALYQVVTAAADGANAAGAAGVDQ
ncbi:thioredoxin reductase [Clostridia bacterium]|nr:thioredoxin reductase [Clostridia bacterium]